MPIVISVGYNVVFSSKHSLINLQLSLFLRRQSFDHPPFFLLLFILLCIHCLCETALSEFIAHRIPPLPFHCDHSIQVFLRCVSTPPRTLLVREVYHIIPESLFEHGLVEALL